MTDNATIARVTRLVAPLIADLKLDLYDVEMRGATLRVTIDTPPGSPSGVTLDTLALVTRMLSRDLDHDDPMPGHYTLEVTSPGLERALRTPQHFQRETGKVVAVRLRDTVNGERRIQGTLAGADERSVTLRLESGDERTVSYDQIDRARTVFEWGPAPKPGKGPAKGAKKSAAGASGRASTPPTDRGSADEPNDQTTDVSTDNSNEEID